MKKLLLASAPMLALFGGTAMAADLRVPPPVYRAPPPVYVYSWTGCYIGGNVGGVWIKKDETLVTPFGTIAPATVEQFLIRGLGTACRVCVVGLPRSDPRRSA